MKPLIPARSTSDKLYVRKPGAGQPPKPARLVFEAVAYVLRTGCQWKALPKERFGSASAIHKRFRVPRHRPRLKPRSTARGRHLDFRRFELAPTGES